MSGCFVALGFPRLVRLHAVGLSPYAAPGEPLLSVTLAAPDALTARSLPASQLLLGYYVVIVTDDSGDLPAAIVVFP
jgi:hypothetical protein